MFWQVAAALLESQITTFVPDDDDDEDINPKSCYDDLKPVILESTNILEKERFTAFPSSLELGNQKPSELLRHLEKFAEGRILGKLSSVSCFCESFRGWRARCWRPNQTPPPPSASQPKSQTRSWRLYRTRRWQPGFERRDRLPDIPLRKVFACPLADNLF